MCGIFGAIRKHGSYDPEAFVRFKGLTDLVAYRGPDDSGYLSLDFRKDQVNTDQTQPFQVFLGHRRLSIIDLSPAGHQPMTDGKGRWIIFNGEIFNFVELRRELEKNGHSFQTESDTEVILHIYDQYGESGFEKLNGMWAFAIADLPGKRIVLSRDRFSMKPLYLFENGNDIYFASEIKQLLPLLDKRELNPEVMSAYLSQGLIDYSNETFFRKIVKVPPKSTFIVCLNTGKTHTHQYWDYTPSNWEGDPSEQFRELFLDSVRIRLRSDVKVGVLLSGGLDSSSIAVLADQLTEGKLESYSIISRDGQCSEEPFIDKLCIAADLKNKKLLFESPDVHRELQQIIYHNDEPFGTFSPIAQYKLVQLIKAQSDVTVLLSGQGGDEAMLGYSKFFFFYLKELVKKGKYYQAATQFLWSLLKRTVVHQFRLGEARRYVRFLNKRTSQSFIRVESAMKPIWECDNLRDRQIADLDHYSVPALAHYEDRIPMAHSLELRHPFLDHRLVDFLISLPEEWKIQDGWTKFILRKTSDKLPDAIRWRRDKQGFIVPEEFWLKNTLKGTIQNIFKKSTLAELGVIDDAQFLRYYDDFQNGRSQIWYTDISRTLMAEIWAKQFLRS